VAENNSQQQSNPFNSFWMAGYECADQMNAFGQRVDLLSATGHLDIIEEDYQNLGLFNMTTVREGVRWSVVEKQPYVYDWSVVGKMLDAGKTCNIQQVWDLCHFGFPDDLSPLHPMFAKRFASFCNSFVHYYRTKLPDDILVLTPINEVSFLSWLGGEVKGTSPWCNRQGWEIKYNLMQAYIEAIEAIKAADPRVRVMMTEPLINIVSPGKEEDEAARARHESQFQVFDMITGKLCPELRGKPEYLDIIGFNFYFNNEWIFQVEEFLDWKKGSKDPRYSPLHILLKTVYERYQRPFIIAETSHPKTDRPLWMEMISHEIAEVLKANLPLWGVCWYPALNRPDWDFTDTWHESGIWDDVYKPAQSQRTLDMPTAKSILKAQEYIKEFQYSNQSPYVGQ